MATVLQQILEWSSSLPAWQRDALRRIVEKGSLDHADTAELTLICKAQHGLAPQTASEPLTSQHIPAAAGTKEPLSLVSLVHHAGVNALAPEQTLSFGPRLTVVYGENAAGKSGYTRILKSACRARGAEGILGNCFVKTAPERPRATIRFQLSGTVTEWSWVHDGDASEDLSYVNVFDSKCASVYLKDRTDVAYRPLGLDVFDKLAAAVESVRNRLEGDQQRLDSKQWHLPEVAVGTKVRTFLDGLNSLSDPNEAWSLATLTADECTRLELLRKWQLDQRSDNPALKAKALRLRSKRIQALEDHLSRIKAVLGTDALTELSRSRDREREAQQAAKRSRADAFDSAPLPDVGSEAWRAMWQSAEKYSTSHAYPDHEYPHVSEGARCVLCQQALVPDAQKLLRGFQQYLASAVEQGAQRARAQSAKLVADVSALVVRPSNIEDALGELALESPRLAERLEALLKDAEAAKLVALMQQSLEPAIPTDEPGTVYQDLSALNVQLLARATELETAQAHDGQDTRQQELGDLEARVELARNILTVLANLDRLKKSAAYLVCLKEAQTKKITRKSTEVTRSAVTEQLKDAFSAELRKIEFSNVDVILEPAGGTKGALYHQLVLKYAPNVDLPGVVSEGEARALAVAAFFAELSTASNPAPIVFDDPVSSLDHLWRERIAGRIVEEARSRQVVLFTHDIVFLLALTRLAEQAGVKIQHQQIRRNRVGAGVCIPELPWVAMKAKARINRLKQELQQLESLERKSELDEYERNAAYFYGLLRETWERCVEEQLVQGVVERYRQGIQTQQIRRLADITEQDCAELEAGMTKSSRWLAGHDQSPAENVQLPHAAEVRADLDALVQWFERVSKRKS